MLIPLTFSTASFPRNTPLLYRRLCYFFFFFLLCVMQRRGACAADAKAIDDTKFWFFFFIWRAFFAVDFLMQKMPAQPLPSRVRDAWLSFHHCRSFFFFFNDIFIYLRAALIHALCLHAFGFMRFLFRWAQCEVLMLSACHELLDMRAIDAWTFSTCAKIFFCA